MTYFLTRQSYDRHSGVQTDFNNDWFDS